MFNDNDFDFKLGGKWKQSTKAGFGILNYGIDVCLLVQNICNLCDLKESQEKCCEKHQKCNIQFISVNGSISKVGFQSNHRNHSNPQPQFGWLE